MRNFGIYGGFFTALSVYSLLYVGSAHADLSINPYPDVSKQEPAIEVVVHEIVLPDTEFTEALESSATKKPQSLKVFDVEAYYSRFKNEEPQGSLTPEFIAQEQEAQVGVKAAEIVVETVPAVPVSISDDSKYVEEIEKAKVDLQQIKLLAKVERERQAAQIDALRAEKLRLERQAAQIEVIRAEKAAMEKQAVDALRTKNVTLEKRAAQVAALRTEKANLERQQVAQVEALRTEKANLERQQAVQIESMRAENSSLEQKAAQVEALRAEKADLERQQEAQMAAMRAEKADLERQQKAQVEALRAEKVAVEKQAIDALRTKNAMLEKRAAQVAALRTEKANLEREAAKLESEVAKDELLSVDKDRELQNRIAQVESLRSRNSSLEQMIAQAEASRIERAEQENLNLMQQALELENMRVERSSFEVKAAQFDVIKAEKDLIERQLELAKQDYEGMSALEKRVDLLENENSGLKQNLAHMVDKELQQMPTADEIIVYERFSSVEPHGGGAFRSTVHSQHKKVVPSELYASASSQDAYAPPSRIYREDGQTNLLDWKANKGMSIKDVLGYWSRQEHVQFVWDSESHFVVSEGFDIQAKYEDAVAELLGRYVDDKIRPVGSLHIDPENGQRILVVQSLKQ